MLLSLGASCLISRKKISKTQFEETEQAAEPGMARVLELADQGWKATMMNMLRALLDKVDSI